MEGARETLSVRKPWDGSKLQQASVSGERAGCVRAEDESEMSPRRRRISSMRPSHGRGSGPWELPMTRGEEESGGEAKG